MNDLMKHLNLSNTWITICVIYKLLSIFMSQDKVQRSIEMKFKVHDSYEAIKNLNTS